jgi:hypothetical protein
MHPRETLKWKTPLEVLTGILEEDPVDLTA